MNAGILEFVLRDFVGFRPFHLKNLTIEVCQCHGLNIHHIQGCLSGIGKKLNILKPGLIITLVPVYFSDSGSVRIDGVDLIAPVQFVGADIPYIHAGIPPVNHGSGRCIFNDACITVAQLFIGHMFGTAMRPPDFRALIGHPMIFFSDPVGCVVASVPVDYTGRNMVKLDHNVGIIAQAPHTIPGFLKRQGFINGSKFFCNSGFTGQNADGNG